MLLPEPTLVKPIANLSHPVLNGPFGDARGKLVGDDNDDSSSYTNANINSSNVDILSTINGQVVGLSIKPISYSSGVMADFLLEQ
jgi:hypothetical protein